MTTHAARLACNLFPTPPERHPHVPTYVYGCQILAYILTEDRSVAYCNLTNEDLELASYAAAEATCSPDILPLAVDRISAVKMEIHATLARRAKVAADLVDHQEQPQEQPQAAQKQPGPPPGDEGRLTPLSPRPNTQPPTAGLATTVPTPTPAAWAF